MFIDGKTKLLKDEFESNPTIGAFIDGSPFRFIHDKYVVPHQHRNKETMQSCSWLNGAWFMFKDMKNRMESEDLILAPLEPTPKMIDSTWYDDIEELSHNSRNEFIYKKMIGVLLKEK